jgi:hypothetical protein
MSRHSLIIGTAVVLALAVGFVGGWIAHRPSGSVASNPHAAGSHPNRAGSAIISGRFVAVGGATTSAWPLTGTLSVRLVTSMAPAALSVPVGPGGKFSVTVKPGIYAISGVSPLFNAGQVGCPAERNPVRVQQGAHAVVDVVCDMK